MPAKGGLYILLITGLLLVLLTMQSIATALMLLSCFIVLNSIVKENKNIILTSFIFGVFIAIFFYYYWEYIYGSPYYLGKYSDDYNYDIYWTEGFNDVYGFNVFKITEFLNGIENGLGYLHNSKGYIATIVLLRNISSYIDGYHTMIPRILNIFILALTAYYSSIITSKYSNNEKLKKIAVFVIFFFPVMIFNSVHVFRDTIVSFILLLIFYLIQNHKKNLLLYLKIAVLLFVLYFFRITIFYVAILIVLILNIKTKSILKLSATALIVFSLLGIFLFKDLASLIFRFSDNYTSLNTERLGTIGESIFSLPILIGIIPRSVFLLFSPVPSFTSFHQFFISISAILQIFFFPFLFWGLLNKNIDSKLRLIFLLIFFSVALTTATFRHVMMYLPFGIIITLLSIYQGGFKFLSNKYILTLFGVISIFIITLVVALYF